MTDLDLNLVNRLAMDILDVIFKFKKENDVELSKEDIITILEKAIGTLKTLEI
jgi:hypothetical protein